MDEISKLQSNSGRTAAETFEGKLGSLELELDCRKVDLEIPYCAPLWEAVPVKVRKLRSFWQGNIKISRLDSRIGSKFHFPVFIIWAQLVEYCEVDARKVTLSLT